MWFLHFSDFSDVVVWLKSRPIQLKHSLVYCRYLTTHLLLSFRKCNIKSQNHFSPYLVLVHGHKFICWAVWKIMLSVCLPLAFHGNDLSPLWLTHFRGTDTVLFMYFHSWVDLDHFNEYFSFLLNQWVNMSQQIACCGLKSITWNSSNASWGLSGLGWIMGAVSKMGKGL